jgi:hypothetical protein
MHFTVMGCSEMVRIFATIGAPAFAVRLQFVAGDFSAIVVTYLERDMPVPCPD